MLGDEELVAKEMVHVDAEPLAEPLVQAEDEEDDPAPQQGDDVGLQLQSVDFVSSSSCRRGRMLVEGRTSLLGIRVVRWDFLKYVFLSVHQGLFSAMNAAKFGWVRRA